MAQNEPKFTFSVYQEDGQLLAALAQEVSEARLRITSNWGEHLCNSLRSKIVDSEHTNTADELRKLFAPTLKEAQDPDTSALSRQLAAKMLHQALERSGEDVLVALDDMESAFSLIKPALEHGSYQKAGPIEGTDEVRPTHNLIIQKRSSGTGMRAQGRLPAGASEGPAVQRHSGRYPEGFENFPENIKQELQHFMDKEDQRALILDGNPGEFWARPSLSEAQLESVLTWAGERHDGITSLRIQRMRDITRIPDLDQRFPNLDTLIIGRNDDVKEIGALPSGLTTVHIWQNEDLEAFPDMGHLTKLEELGLGYNRKAIDHVPGLEKLHNLTSLKIHDQSLQKTIDLSDLEELQHVSLMYNQLSNVRLPISGKLTSVNLSNNQLQHVPEFSHDLEEVAIDNNPLVSLENLPIAKTIGIHQPQIPMLVAHLKAGNNPSVEKIEFRGQGSDLIDDFNRQEFLAKYSGEASKAPVSPELVTAEAEKAVEAASAPKPEEKATKTLSESMILNPLRKLIDGDKDKDGDGLRDRNDVAAARRLAEVLNLDEKAAGLDNIRDEDVFFTTKSSVAMVKACKKAMDDGDLTAAEREEIQEAFHTMVKSRRTSGDEGIKPSNMSAKLDFEKDHISLK